MAHRPSLHRDRPHHTVQSERAYLPYLAYGVSLTSPLAFPELPLTRRRPDALLRLGPTGRSVPHGDAAPERRQATADEVCIGLGAAGCLVVRRGSELVTDADPALHQAAIRLFVLGVGFAALLWQRRTLVLHACAAGCNGEAILILGAKGYGKSSLTAALYARGWSLVADDVVGIPAEAPAAALPGLPQLKVWPDAAAACLSLDEASLPRLAPGYEKRCLRTDHRFPATPVPIAAAYVLDGGPQPQAERLTGQEALIEIVRNTYHIDLLGDMGLAAFHLQQAARLAAAVPLYRLRRPDDLAQLPRLAAFVEDHSRHLR